MGNRDYSGMLRNIDYTDPFSKKNRIHIIQIAPGYAKGELVVAEDSMNFGGLVHGGALATLADMVGGTCACSKGGSCVTANCSMEFLRPASSGTLFCEATPKKMGKTLSVIQMSIADEEGRLIATGTYTFFLFSEENPA